VNHWLDRERRKIAQDTFAHFGWDDVLFVELFLENFRHSRHDWRRIHWLLLAGISSLRLRWEMRGWIRPAEGGVYADILVDESPLFVPIPKDVSRLVRSYWIYVYLSGLIRYN
jgi:hypothetical protein